MREMLDELTRTRAAQIFHGEQFRGGGTNPVDAAVVRDLQGFKSCPVRCGQKLRIIDKAAIEDSHVERPVWTRGHVDGTEPGIRGGQKRPILLELAAPCDEGGAVWDELIAMDDVT